MAALGHVLAWREARAHAHGHDARGVVGPAGAEGQGGAGGWRRRRSELLPPGRNNTFDYRMDPVPAVGQHTEAILRELGQTEAEVAALRASGAI